MSYWYCCNTLRVYCTHVQFGGCPTPRVALSTCVRSIARVHFIPTPRACMRPGGSVTGRLLMPTPSPIQLRIAELQKYQNYLTDVRVQFRDVPLPYRADIAAELRAIADSLSDPIDEILDGYAAPTKSSEDAAPDEREDEEGDDGQVYSVADKMRQWFNLRANEPASIPAICAGARVNTDTCRSILYKRNRGRFVQVTPPGGAGHPSLWKLSDELWQNHLIDKVDAVIR